MSHNYDPVWDYEIDEEPEEDVKELVQETLRSHADLLRAMGFAGPVSVHYVRGLEAEDVHAKFVSGTSSAPVIVLDASHLSEVAARNGVRLSDAVESTLLHEYGHAWYESVGEEPEDEEKRVEQFAYVYWETGSVDLAMRELK